MTNYIIALTADETLVSRVSAVVTFKGDQYGNDRAQEQYSAANGHHNNKRYTITMYYYCFPRKHPARRLGYLLASSNGSDEKVHRLAAAVIEKFTAFTLKGWSDYL